MSINWGEGCYAEFVANAVCVCPCCGHEKRMSLNPNGVYDEREFGLDLTCDGCGSEHTVMDIKWKDCG